MKDILGGIWSLVVLAGVAMFMGWIDIPQPVIAFMDRLEGNGEDAFKDVTNYAPGEQLRFIRAVNDARVAYQEAANDMAKGALRPKRKDAICAVNNGYTDGEWTGLIETLSTNGDGDGVLAVKIAPHIVLKTWNNSMSDINSNTLLKPDDPVHAVAVTMKEGEMVKFTGMFFRDETDCISESSLTIEGSMTDPEFIIKFASLTKFTK